MNDNEIILRFNTKGMIKPERMKFILKMLVDDCAINKSDTAGFDIKNHNEFRFKNNQKMNIDFYENGEYSISLNIDKNIDQNDFGFIVKLMENLTKAYLKSISIDGYKILFKNIFMGISLNVAYAFLLAKKDIGDTAGLILMIAMSLFNYIIFSNMISNLYERRKNTRKYMESAFEELRRFVDIAERDIVMELKKDLKNGNKQ